MKKQEVFISIEKKELDKIVQSLEHSLYEIATLKARIRELEAQAQKTSKNSSKPPSSDGFKKEVKNNRVKSGRKPGGQKGHKGSTLKIVAVPDKTEYHPVSGVCECGKNLSNEPIKNIFRRQVIELPEKLYEITEHQVEQKQCSCGRLHEAWCRYAKPVQYGNRIKSLGVYLNQCQFLPYNRVQEFMKDILHISIGGGTLHKSNIECYNNLYTTEMEIKSVLKRSKVLNNDETGIRTENALKWVHSTSTPTHTHYAIHDKRGREAMDSIGILPEFNGVGVHDRFASYNKYNFQHAYCNAHILRDLKYLHENLKEAWAKKMIKLLVKANNAKKENNLTDKNIKRFKEKYGSIVELAIESEKKKEHPKISVGKKGKPPTSPSLRMINMFLTKEKEVLRFLENPDVPFDNNLAERDLRMVKLKQKVSGCFRTNIGAKIFLRIRSYTSTSRKQGHAIFDAIQNAVDGNPLKVALAE